MGLAGRLSDGCAELCGGAVAARQEDGSWSAGAEAEVTSGSSRERFARIGADAFDHRAKAVGALRRQMLAKSEFVEHGQRIRRQDLLRRVAGIKRQQDRDQTAHDVGVAVAEIVQPRFAVAAAVDLLGEPDLAGAAIDLVGRGMFRLRHRRQRAAEFDDVAVAVVPLVQQRKIIPDLVDVHRGPRPMLKSLYRMRTYRKRWKWNRFQAYFRTNRVTGAVV